MTQRPSMAGLDVLGSGPPKNTPPEESQKHTSKAPKRQTSKAPRKHARKVAGASSAGEGDLIKMSLYLTTRARGLLEKEQFERRQARNRRNMSLSDLVCEAIEESFG